MRRPEIALVKGHFWQDHRVARDVTGFLRKSDHFANQHVVKPRVGPRFEFINHRTQPLGHTHRAIGCIRFDLDLADIKEIGRLRHTVDRVHQLPRHSIPRRERK